jgi:DNA-binding transcriptional ArsR family regulator
MLAPSPETLDHTLIALADPTRRAILRQLVNGDARVTELAEPFEISLNSISKHIRILERGRLVTRRRSGREHIISINPDSLDEASRWINEQRSLWAARLDMLGQLLEEEDEAGEFEQKGMRDER